MTPEGAANLMRNIVDTYVKPELARRQLAGEPADPEVWAAQVIFTEGGPKIRLNREVQLDAQPAGSEEVGDYVEFFNGGCRAFSWARLKPGDKNVKHMTVFQKGITSSWQTIFSLGEYAEPSEPPEGEISFEQGYVEPTLSEWEQLYQDHDSVAEEVLAINSPTPEMPIEGVMVVALQRSRHLLQAYVLLLNSKNLTAASALIRMQLDSLMRVNACFLVENPLDLWQALKNGDPWSRVKSKDGKHLTDAYLHDKLSEKIDWASETYTQMSGYVHLSRPHLESAVKGENFLGMIIKQGPAAENVTEAELLHNSELFIRVTRALLVMCSEYARARYSPGPVVNN
jgi:hypothetical protein